MTEEEYRALIAGRNGGSQQPHKKRSKYNAKSIFIEGIRFDSKLEADYYEALKLLQRAGEIRGFCRQPRFVITYGDENTRAVEYVADYVIFNNDGTYRIVDTKGMETEVFKLKMKSFREKYPRLTVEVVKKGEI